MSDIKVLRVYNYEPGTKKSKQKRTLTLPTDNDVSALTLSYIRGFLAENKVFDSPDVTAPFCDAYGTEMADSMTLSVYFDQLVDGGASEASSQASGGTAKIYRVYYKKRKKMGLDDKQQDGLSQYLKKQVDLKLQKSPELREMKAELLASAFKGDEWKASTSGQRSIAANLTEKDWSVLVRTNCLLSGYKLVCAEVDAPENKKKVILTAVERTPFNAFNLKARPFSDYEIAAPTAKGGEESSVAKDLYFHIPRFRVDDAATVNVVEVKTALESSLAKSSFSSTSLEASAGGGFWGVSAAAKGGFSKKDGKKELTADSEKHEETLVSYNFPRVTLFLNADSLELTPEIMEDIPKVKGKESLKAFGDKYGDIFSRQVKLGGKLTSATSVDSEAHLTENQRENALKIAAAASFSGTVGSFSVEGSFEKGENHQDTETKQEFTSNLTWEATGGDTTLCNDPPKWCGTVGNFYNWRVVEHDDPIPLPKFISTFSGFEHVEKQFEAATGYTDGVPVAKPVYTRVKLRFVGRDGSVGGSLCTWDKSSTLKKVLNLMRNSYLANTIPDCDITILGNDIDKWGVWTLERWVQRGGRSEHPYGAKAYMFNNALPRDTKYLGLLDKPIRNVIGSGMVMPVPESKRVPVTIDSPPGMEPKTGPLKTGDIVEIRLPPKPGSTTPRTMAKVQYFNRGDFKYEDTPSTISWEIAHVPGVAERRKPDKSQWRDDSYPFEDQNFHRFQIEVLGTSETP